VRASSSGTTSFRSDMRESPSNTLHSIREPNAGGYEPSLKRLARRAKWIGDHRAPLTPAVPAGSGVIRRACCLIGWRWTGSIRRRRADSSSLESKIRKCQNCGTKPP
jgi:hypothetical protein